MKPSNNAFHMHKFYSTKRIVVHWLQDSKWFPHFGKIGKQTSSSSDVSFCILGSISENLYEKYPTYNSIKQNTMDYQQYSTYSGYQGYNPYGQYSGANHLKVGKLNLLKIINDMYYLRYSITSLKFNYHLPINWIILINKRDYITTMYDYTVEGCVWVLREIHCIQEHHILFILFWHRVVKILEGN